MGYVGDSSQAVADEAMALLRAALPSDDLDRAVRQGAARDAATATRLAVEALGAARPPTE